MYHGDKAGAKHQIIQAINKAAIFFQKQIRKDEIAKLNSNQANGGHLKHVVIILETKIYCKP
jgi:hypothetical protein